MKTKKFKDAVQKGIRESFENGRVPWNKGLTKETDNRINSNKGRKILWGDKISKSLKGIIPWNKGMRGEYHLWSKERPNPRTGVKCKGKHISDTAKKRMSERMINGGAAKARRATVRISKPQMEMYLTIKESFSDAELEYPIKTKRGIKLIDTAIPSKKIAFEYDGSYWHQDKKADEIREQAMVDEGWVVIRFNEENINELEPTLKSIFE